MMPPPLCLGFARRLGQTAANGALAGPVPKHSPQFLARRRLSGGPHSIAGRRMPAATARESRLRVSVVVPHLNQTEALDRCLASLAAGSRRPDEIIVVDNGSVRLPESVCARHPGVRLAREDTPGPGPARNTGVAMASGDVLAFIDADCVAAPDWIAVVAERFATDLGVQVLGGAVLVVPADAARPTALEAYEMVYSYRMDWYLRERGFTGAGNMAVRRTTWERVGPFAGIATAEDIDWCHRALALGVPVVHEPTMRVWHPARPGIAELFAKSSRVSAQAWSAARKSLRGRAAFAARALAMPLMPLADLPRLVRTRRLRGLRPRLLAFSVVCRLRLQRAGVMLWLLAGGDGSRLSGTWNR